VDLNIKTDRVVVEILEKNHAIIVTYSVTMLSPAPDDLSASCCIEQLHPSERDARGIIVSERQTTYQGRRRRRKKSDN